MVKNCEQDSSFSKGKFLKLIKGLYLEKLFRIVFIRLAPAQKEVKSKLAQIIFFQLGRISFFARQVDHLSPVNAGTFSKSNKKFCLLRNGLAYLQIKVR